MQNPYCSEEEVAHYTCRRTRVPIVVNGKLDEEAWQLAARSPRFVDVVSGGRGLYDTRAAALWDEKALYIGFWVEEPCVEAHLTERDALIFNENDVEVFIDGGDAYYKFEINALGTVYEVFFIWQDAYKRSGRFDVPQFDLLTGRVLSFGGNNDRKADNFWWGTHPRKCRWAFLDWDFPGLQAAVQVDGRLNDCSTPHNGWTVELAFPWAGMKWLADGRQLPAGDGDIWRIFFGRYNNLNFGGEQISAGWAWNRVGNPDNHAPECFTQVDFSTDYVDEREESR